MGPANRSPALSSRSIQYSACELYDGDWIEWCFLYGTSWSICALRSTVGEHVSETAVLLKTHMRRECTGMENADRQGHHDHLHFCIMPGHADMYVFQF